MKIHVAIVVSIAFMLIGCKKANESSQGINSDNELSVTESVVDTANASEEPECEEDFDAVTDEDEWAEKFPVLKFENETERSVRLLQFLTDSLPNCEFNTYFPLDSSSYLVTVSGGRFNSGLYSVNVDMQRLIRLDGGDVEFKEVAGSDSGVTCIVLKSNSMSRGKMSNWWSAVIPVKDQPLKLYDLITFNEDGESGGMPSKERAAAIGLDTASIMEAFDMGYSGEKKRLFIKFDCSFMDGSSGRKWVEQQRFEIVGDKIELIRSVIEGAPTSRQFLRPTE